MADEIPDDTVEPDRGELVMAWGYADGEGPDICYYAGDGVHRTDQRLLHHYLCSERPHPRLDGTLSWDKSLLNELVARGYDLATLKFSIRKKD